jgi:hypothetical protein
MERGHDNSFRGGYIRADRGSLRQGRGSYGLRARSGRARTKAARTSLSRMTFWGNVRAAMPAEHCGLGFQFRFGTLIVAQMCSHQTLPKLAMVRNVKMQQLVHDHVVRQLPIKREQVVAEVQISRRGTGGPFVAHGANGERAHMHTELVGPLAHAGLELIFVSPGRQVTPLRSSGAPRRCCLRARRP